MPDNQCVLATLFSSTRNASFLYDNRPVCRRGRRASSTTMPANIYWVLQSPLSRCDGTPLICLERCLFLCTPPKLYPQSLPLKLPRPLNRWFCLSSARGPDLDVRYGIHPDLAFDFPADPIPLTSCPSRFFLSASPYIYNKVSPFLPAFPWFIFYVLQHICKSACYKKLSYLLKNKVL